VSVDVTEKRDFGALLFKGAQPRTLNSSLNILHNDNLVCFLALFLTIFINRITSYSLTFMLLAAEVILSSIVLMF
jgi:hypothetical protein